MLRSNHESATVPEYRIGSGVVKFAYEAVIPRPFQRETAHLARYFVGEKSVGCMYVTSTFSTNLSACSDFIIS
jgi:hypothetical protein